MRPIQSQLNAQQLQAVENIVVHRHGSAPYLVFGPPGTGKTMVVAETVLQVLIEHPSPRLLVCAPSNNAVDQLALRLQRADPALRLLRYGAGVEQRADGTQRMS